jgi:mRNA interferase MazF
MVATIKTSITLPEAHCNQIDRLAQDLQISRSQLFEVAIEEFLRNHSQPAPSIAPACEKRVRIDQGDIYWLQLDDSSGWEPGIPHPHVVVQENVLNHSRIHTVVVCAVTSNLKRAAMPGNVMLDAGEANLPKLSVVEVSKVSSVDKALLGEYIGTLSEQRIAEILAGMRFLQLSFFAR